MLVKAVSAAENIPLIIINKINDIPNIIVGARPFILYSLSYNKVNLYFIILLYYYIVMKNKPNIIQFKNIYFSYTDDNNFVLKNLSFDIYENEYICIIGHNGSGKSTISKVLAALLMPKSGNIYIKGKKLNQNNFQELKKNIGIIFQNPDNQFVGITSEDDIAFGLENYKIKNEYIQEIIDNSAKVIDITDLLKKEAHSLSGGQKQKVAITSILSLLPSIIIFDESTSMLDPKAKEELKFLMKELQKYNNKTIISITHDMEELNTADRILFMSEGTVLRFDTPKKMLFDYDFMKKNSLDVPYDLKLVHLLSESGAKFKPSLKHSDIVKQVSK